MISNQKRNRKYVSRILQREVFGRVHSHDGSLPLKTFDLKILTFIKKYAIIITES